MLHYQHFSSHPPHFSAAEISRTTLLRYTSWLNDNLQTLATPATFTSQNKLNRTINTNKLCRWKTSLILKLSRKECWTANNSNRKSLCIISLRVIMRSYFQNSCFLFHRGIQTPRNNKSTRPTTSCFHFFLGVWIPRWNTRSRPGNCTRKEKRYSPRVTLFQCGTRRKRFEFRI